MAKPTRSPLLGYNHNVKYNGRIFHVQTEDSGPGHPRLFTHLYFEGTILATKRHDYDGAAPEELVRTLMQGQHKAILKDLKAGTLDDRLITFFAKRGEPFTPERDLPPSPAPAGEPEALDLDALPSVIAEEVIAEEAPTPPAVPEPVVDVTTTPSGPGVYAVRSKTRERPFRTGGTAPFLPRVEPRTPAPAVVGSAGRAGPPPTPAPVVVQRQVAVGGPGAGGGAGGRPRRPAPPIPYVVQEGSHALPPPRPLAPAPVTSANAPVTSGAPPPPRTPAPEVISDKSLDEVILAYLQGDVK